MRRSLALLLASSMGFATPVFAQSATPGFAQNSAPVLIGQPPTSQVVGQGDQSSNGQDALAQDQTPGLFGPGGPSPLLIAGGVAIGAGLIIYAATQNNNNPVSP